MKRNWLLLACLLILSGFLTACADDNPSPVPQNQALAIVQNYQNYLNAGDVQNVVNLFDGRGFISLKNYPDLTSGTLVDGTWSVSINVEKTVSEWVGNGYHLDLNNFDVNGDLITATGSITFGQHVADSQYEIRLKGDKIYFVGITFEDMA